MFFRTGYGTGAVLLRPHGYSGGVPETVPGSMRGGMATNRRMRRRVFLAKHPTCIFCGGETPATTEDHVPSRQLFHGRNWPEEFIFPACQRCNADTRHEEQVVAMLARLYPDAETEEKRKEMERIIKAVDSNYPEVLVEMQPSSHQVRGFLRLRTHKTIPLGRMM